MEQQRQTPPVAPPVSSQAPYGAPPAYYAAPGGGYYCAGADPAARQQALLRRKVAGRLTAKANWIGAAMLASLGVGSLVTLVFGAVMDLWLPGVSRSDSLFYLALQYAVFSVASILLPFWLAAVAARQQLSRVIPFEKHSAGVGLGCILFAFLAIALGNGVSELVITLFPHVVDNLVAYADPDPTTPVELLLCLLYVAAIPALVEEFAFRGVVLGTMRPYGDRFAIYVSALLFALLHGNFVQIPFAFFVGLALGYAVVRTGSIVPAILIHFINNATSVVLSYVEPGLTEQQDLVLSIGLYVLWTLLGAAGFVILRLYDRRGLKGCYRSYVGCISTGRRTGSFFRSPTIIIGMVIFLGSALLLAV